MSIQTFLLAVVVVVYGAAQYILAAQAIRDLLRRPSVRGGNKTVWGIVILTLPIAGALLYTWMGPTSFLRRGERATAARSPRATISRRPTTATPAASHKVTPIIALRDARAARGASSLSRQTRPLRVDATASDSMAGRQMRPRTPERLRRTGS